jgi:CheY-like chemotaxis protein
VILLDVMMPVMNGWQFRQKQLSEPELARLPVIVLSAATEIQSLAADMKAVDYFNKPFTRDEILNAVQRYC